MGNTFMDRITAGNFNSDVINTNNTALQNFILDFYRNKYKFTGIYDGPKLNEKDPPNVNIGKMLADTKGYKLNEDVDYGNFSRRRACCLNNKDIPLSLPSYNEKEKKVVTTTLNFPMFNTNEELNDPKNCTIDKDNINWKTTSKDGAGHPFATTQCKNFYQGFCDTVYNDRVKNYTLSSIYNGPYQNNQNNKKNKFSELNPFSDCNCLNSAFNRGAKTSGDAGTPDEKAQTLDVNCSSSITDNTAFYIEWVKKDMLCINSIDLNGAKIAAANNSIINIEQKSSCIANTSKNEKVSADAGKSSVSNNETKNNETNTVKNSTDSAPNSSSSSAQSSAPSFTPSSAPSSTPTSAPSSIPSSAPSSAQTTVPSSALTTALAGEWIKGLPNIYLFIIIGVVVFIFILIMMLSGGRRRPSYNEDD